MRRKTMLTIKVWMLFILFFAGFILMCCLPSDSLSSEDWWTVFLLSKGIGALCLGAVAWIIITSDSVRNHLEKLCKKL